MILCVKTNKLTGQTIYSWIIQILITDLILILRSIKNGTKKWQLIIWWKRIKNLSTSISTTVKAKNKLIVSKETSPRSCLKSSYSNRESGETNKINYWLKVKSTPDHFSSITLILTIQIIWPDKSCPLKGLKFRTDHQFSIEQQDCRCSKHCKKETMIWKRTVWGQCFTKKETIKGTVIKTRKK